MPFGKPSSADYSRCPCYCHGFLSRSEGLERMQKSIQFTDRFNEFYSTEKKDTLLVVLLAMYRQAAVLEFYAQPRTFTSTPDGLLIQQLLCPDFYVFSSRITPRYRALLGLFWPETNWYRHQNCYKPSPDFTNMMQQYLT